MADRIGDNANWQIYKDRYNVAGLKILMTTYCEKTQRQAKAYISEDKWNEDEASGVIDLGMDFYKERGNEKMPGVTYDSVEYVYTGMLFNRLLVEYGGCMIHSSAVVVDGYAYLFSADSGTGKSTHTGLWLDYFKDRAYIINDDKPALRREGNQWYVYGTPWSGKTDLNVNTKVKLGAIVFIERDQENHIEEMDEKEAIPRVMKQTMHRFRQEKKMDMVLNNIEKLITENSIYKMGCNISQDAVIMAYNKIRRV